MEYNCQNFKDGNVLTAECLNHIEQGVQHVCETLDCLCGDGQPEKLSEYVQSAVKSSTPKEVANALKGSASGEVVALNDVSPIEHEMGVTVTKKNLCSIGTVEVTTAKMLDIGTTLPPLKDGQVYIISCLITSNDTDADACMIAFYDEAGIRISSVALKRNERVYIGSDSFAGASKLYLYASNGYSSSVDDTATFADIQIEVANSGAAASAYTPYIEDLSAVTVSAMGKNLWTTDKTYPFYDNLDYDSETQIYTLTGGFSKSVYTLPKPLPIGTQFVISVEFISGTITNTVSYGLGIGGYHMGDDGNNWHGYVKIPVGENIDLTGQKIAETVKSGKTVTDLYIFCSTSVATIHEPIKFRVQLEINEAATDWESSTVATYPVGADGTVQGIKSIYPNTTLLTDTAGAVIDCSYNKDANKVVNSLIERIAALEAAVL